MQPILYAHKMCVAFFLCLPYAIAHPGIYLLSRYSIWWWWWCCCWVNNTPRAQKNSSSSLLDFYIYQIKKIHSTLFLNVYEILYAVTIFLPDLNRCMEKKCTLKLDSSV